MSIYPRGRGYSWEFLVGVCRPSSPNPDPISDQKNAIFHTHFQTRPVKSIPVFRPGLWAEFMLSFLRLERRQKNSSNPFRIRIFSFILSYSFGTETIKTFIQSRSSLKNHTRFQTKMGKVYTRFQTKRSKPYPMGRDIPYIAFIGEYPPSYMPGSREESERNKMPDNPEFF